MVSFERTHTVIRSKYTDIDRNFINKITLPLCLPELRYVNLYIMGTCCVVGIWDSPHKFLCILIMV